MPLLSCLRRDVTFTTCKLLNRRVVTNDKYSIPEGNLIILL